MGRYSVPILVGLATIILTGCAAPAASGTTESRESDDAPVWATVHPNAEGMIYGVGQSKKQNPSLSKNTAAQRAREEVASAVKIKVEGVIKDFMQESGIG